MNPIAEKAKYALTADGFPIKNNECQKWARTVVQNTEVGHKYDGDFQLETAKLAGLSMLKNHPDFSFRYSPGMILQPGDLCYKTEGSGGSGHVGIYIGNNQVAENSSYHWNATGGKDARGIRTLQQFGAFQIVVRFPVKVQQPAAPKPENPTFKAFFNDVEIKGALYDKETHQVYAPIRSTLGAAGIDILAYGDHVADKNRVYTWGKKR